MSTKPVALHVQGLSKYYGTQRGIEGVSLEVYEGEVFGFIGPNGAGKSTTIRTILGLLQASKGRVRLWGETVDAKHAGWRKHVGYLPSEVHYYSEMTSRELLHYHCDLMDAPNAHASIETLADYFELDLDRPIADLSFGNKKKCAIVQALVHEPKLLILDEPTSGLDPLMQNKFFDLLEQRNAAGTTLFFSSHILSEVQRMCHRAAIIREGKIVAVERIDKLLAKQMKQVKLVLTPHSSIELLEGAQNVHWSGQKVQFDYLGSSSALVAWLAQQPLHDLTLTEPDLEYIFMNYYRR
jgi:ABC-2 type transport system ATP-binding protein